MAKAKPQIGKSGKKSSGDQPKILLLGNGIPLSWWLDRLEEAGMPFAHLENDSQGNLPWTDPDIIIETEDLRFQDSEPHLHEHDHEHSHDDWDPEDDPLPTVGNGNGHGHGHGHLHSHPMDTAEIVVPSGGLILAPCYSSSPTAMAAMYGESSDQVVGYTLFPRPEGAAGLGVIEISQALQTSDETWNQAGDRLKAMGFSPEAVGDAPAGIFGRSLAMLINEAALAKSEGIASVEDIDKAMQLGVNYPKGLFEWADELGADLILDMLEGLYDHYLDDRYRPAPLLRHIVAAGMKFSELKQ